MAAHLALALARPPVANQARFEPGAYKAQEANESTRKQYTARVANFTTKFRQNSDEIPTKTIYANIGLDIY